MKQREKRVQRIAAAVAVELQRRREAAGLSMNRVAEDAGISQQMVSYIERGMRNPSLDVLLRIASALDTPLSKVLAAAEKRVR